MKLRKIKIKHLILLFIIMYLFMLLSRQRVLMKDLKSKRTVLKEDIEKLENDNKELEKEIANSNSVEFIEKAARDELGMVKPREVIYIDKNKAKNLKNKGIKPINN